MDAIEMKEKHDNGSDDEEADVIDYGSLHESYKRVMGTALQTFIHLRETPISGWTLLRFEISDFDPVTISRLATAGGGGGKTMRISGIMNGQARRYAYAARDHDPETRLPWDLSAVSVKEHHSFHSGEGKLHYVECTTMHRGTPLWSAGILFACYDRCLDEYRVTFCAVEHPRFKCPPGAVVATDRWTLFAKDTCKKKGSRRCEVTIIHEVGDEDRAEMMRSRVYALDTAVTKWDHFYGALRDPKILENRK